MKNLYAHLSATDICWSGYTGTIHIDNVPKNLCDALHDNSFTREIPTLHVWSPKSNKHIHFELFDCYHYCDGKLHRWEFIPIDAQGSLVNLRIYVESYNG